MANNESTNTKKTELTSIQQSIIKSFPSEADALTRGQEIRQTENKQKEEDNEETIIKKVISTPLLSLEGIRARLILKDRLLLEDLTSYNERRARLIQRLETDIEQANTYLNTLTKDEGINAQISIYINEYKRALLSVLQDILKETVEEKVKEEILNRLGEEIAIIESEI